MADNQNIIVEEPKKKFTWASFRAGLKEWFRKQIVNLKRRPTNIAFFVLIVTSLVYLIGFSGVAQFLTGQRINTAVVRWSGLCSFVTFLFSILVLLLFMNSFPKRKKANKVMLVFTYLFLAIMIFTNVVCLTEVAKVSETAASVGEARTLYVTHIVFLCITIVMLSLTPLFKMLLMKINTRKELESTVSEMKNGIDLEDAD